MILYEKGVGRIHPQGRCACARWATKYCTETKQAKEKDEIKPRILPTQNGQVGLSLPTLGHLVVHGNFMISRGQPTVELIF
jgi:hypothetical protein